uniref:1-alkyl-2-acetylglycerophosphocholine esterase n=2 Tax=Ciona intestinalis TaxID=7719 RepID=F6V377_CIOIN
MNKWQHVPLNDYEDNLKKMIKHCVDHGVSKEKIIFISPPPVDEALWLIKMKEMGLPYDTSDRKLKVTEKYAEVCKKVANTAGCKYIDLWSALMNTADLKKYLSDGLHLNDTGSLLLADCITPVIQELTSHLPMQLPAWDVFDL